MIPTMLLTLVWDAAKAIAVAWVVIQSPWARGVIASAWRRFHRWLPESRINRKLHELRNGIDHVWDSLTIYLLRVEALELGAQLPVVTCGATGELLWASQPYLALVGTQLTALIHQGWASCIHPDDLERVTKLWQQAREGEGSDIAMEFRLVHQQTSKPVWVHAIVRAARNPYTNRVAGWVATLSPLSRPPVWFHHTQPGPSTSGCPSGYYEPPMGM